MSRVEMGVINTQTANLSPNSLSCKLVKIVETIKELVNKPATSPDSDMITAQVKKWGYLNAIEIIRIGKINQIIRPILADCTDASRQDRQKCKDDLAALSELSDLLEMAYRQAAISYPCSQDSPESKEFKLSLLQIDRHCDLLYSRLSHLDQSQHLESVQKLFNDIQNFVSKLNLSKEGAEWDGSRGVFEINDFLARWVSLNIDAITFEPFKPKVPFLGLCGPVVECTRGFMRLQLLAIGAALSGICRHRYNSFLNSSHFSQLLYAKDPFLSYCYLLLQQDDTLLHKIKQAKIENITARDVPDLIADCIIEHSKEYSKIEMGAVKRVHKNRELTNLFARVNFFLRDITKNIKSVHEQNFWEKLLGNDESIVAKLFRERMNRIYNSRWTNTIVENNDLTNDLKKVNEHLKMLMEVLLKSDATSLIAHEDELKNISLMLNGPWKKDFYSSSALFAKIQVSSFHHEPELDRQIWLLEAMSNHLKWWTGQEVAEIVDFYQSLPEGDRFRGVKVMDLPAPINHDLIIALNQRDFDAAKKALEGGANLNVIDLNGNNLLQLAALEDDLEKCEFLLKAKDKNGNSINLLHKNFQDDDILSVRIKMKSELEKWEFLLKAKDKNCNFNTKFLGDDNLFIGLKKDSPVVNLLQEAKDRQALKEFAPNSYMYQQISEVAAYAIDAGRGLVNFVLETLNMLTQTISRYVLSSAEGEEMLNNPPEPENYLNRPEEFFTRGVTRLVVTPSVPKIIALFSANQTKLTARNHP